MKIFILRNELTSDMKAWLKNQPNVRYHDSVDEPANNWVVGVTSVNKLEPERTLSEVIGYGAAPIGVLPRWVIDELVVEQIENHNWIDCADEDEFIWHITNSGEYPSEKHNIIL